MRGDFRKRYACQWHHNVTFTVPQERLSFPVDGTTRLIERLDTWLDGGRVAVNQESITPPWITELLSGIAPALAEELTRFVLHSYQSQTVPLPLENVVPIWKIKENVFKENQIMLETKE